MLSARDAKGQTPFMSAVGLRAYRAASILFETIIKISKAESLDDDGYHRSLNSMIFPEGELLDWLGGQTNVGKHLTTMMIAKNLNQCHNHCH